MATSIQCAALKSETCVFSLMPCPTFHSSEWRKLGDIYYCRRYNIFEERGEKAAGKAVVAEGRRNSKAKHSSHFSSLQSSLCNNSFLWIFLLKREDSARRTWCGCWGFFRLFYSHFFLRRMCHWLQSHNALAWVLYIIGTAPPEHCCRGACYLFSSFYALTVPISGPNFLRRPKVWCFFETEVSW